MPEIHPPGPGPPAPAGHRLPASASVSQKLPAVPVIRAGGADGQPRACRGPGLSFHGRAHRTFRKGSFSPRSPRTLFFDRPVRIPSCKNECLLPTVLAACEAALPSPDTALQAAKHPGPLPGGGPARPPTGLRSHGSDRIGLIREPVSIFKRMNKTLGQETLCVCPEQTGPAGGETAPE